MGTENLGFLRGDINRLPFAGDTVDAVLAHSLVEILPDPLPSLGEARRVMKPGAVIGLAAVDYGGVILSGPGADVLARFYALKEAYWQHCAGAEPRRGRALRRYLVEAGFREVEASARYVSYGTPERVRLFGDDRARKCEEPSFARCAVARKLVDAKTLEDMAAAWRTWGSSTAGFMAFPWCTAVGWK
jgi:SAM-dependent methyltransferase